MVKVLFVCTGNICRSPIAHGLLRVRAAEAGLGDRVGVSSAGTHGYHVGDPPDPRAIATAARHGVDIGDLRARKVAVTDFQDHDLICALEESHKDVLDRLSPPEWRPRIRLLMEFAPDPPTRNVPDPYYGGARDFEQAFALIDSAVRGIVARIGQGDA